MGARKRRGNGQGWIRQLPSRRWQAKFPGPDGVVRTAPETFDTKPDAAAWLKLQARKVEAGTWTTGAGGGTFGDYAATWIVSRDLKPTTRSDYRRMLDNYILPTFESMPLDAITVKAVKAWHKDLLPGRETARAHTYSLLRTILNTAYQDDLITSNPCRIRGAGAAKRVSKTELPTAVQVHALADAMGSRTDARGRTQVIADGKYRVMTLVAAWCGLRFGEVAELRRKDLVIVDGVPVSIKVRRGVVRVDGERIAGSPKSHAGVRDVNIPPHIRGDVATYVDGLPDGKDELIFPGSRNGVQMAHSSLLWQFNQAKEDVGLPTLRWHDLRHFSATTAAMTGATLAELQARLGHSTTQAAMRYQHAASNRDAEIAEAMSNVLPMKRKGA